MAAQRPAGLPQLDYRTPIGLSAGAEFTWYRTPGTQLLHSEMEGERMDFYTTDLQRINAWKFYLAQEHSLKNSIRRAWTIRSNSTLKTRVNKLTRQQVVCCRPI